MTSSTKRILLVVVIAVILASGALMALNGRKHPANKPVVVAQAPTEDQPKTQAIPDLKFASAASYDEMARENESVKPSVADYSLEPDLSNVSNIKLYKPVLEPQLIEMIAKNKFAVSPTEYIQMFHVYENNEYQRPEKFPSFITTDSMLHTYHIFYDYTLRQVETYKLFDAAVKLTDAMLKASEDDYAKAKDAKVKDAALRNVAYFAVARKLLTNKELPKAAEEMASADLGKIEKHEGFSASAVIGVSVDFSQFVPRGHYTRSEKLKKYFKAMMWYGLTAMATPQNMPASGALLEPTRQAALITRNLVNPGCQKLWDMIYEPTAFYVGTADDLTYYQYSGLLKKIYGESPSLDQFADDGKVFLLIKGAQKLPGSGIAVDIGPGLSPTHQFRFMGQRYIPDSEVSHKLGQVLWPDNPSGLDVLASMGSVRALDIRKEFDKLKSHDGYLGEMAKMKNKMTALPRQKWQSNLYYGWLWSLQAAVEPAPKGYPAFMNSSAWIDKSLWTALGSWTELRHDTILYAKQSVAECGGDGEEPPPTPKGYVEPNLEFWTRLRWLNKYTMEGLESRKLLTDELKDKFAKLDDWLTFCRNVTIKELTGKKVTTEEYDQICIYGSELEALTLSFAGSGELVSDADKDMAVIADVHTNGGSCLEEGTGRPAAIYVVVPIEGKLYLTRGAVYTQYEFSWPASDRLTDEKWQDMLKQGKQPPVADWIKSFFINTKKKPAQEFGSETGGC